MRIAVRSLYTYRYSLAAAIAACGWLAAAAPAHAIIQGNPSSLDRHMVRIVGGRGILCTGVAIDRMVVVTAAHCGRGGVSAAGRHIGVASVTRGTVTLDNGRRVRVSGDAAILRLRSALPASIVPLPVGDDDLDGPFVIAGYGTPSESHRSFGTLREATLVDSNVERHMLVDPNRKGAISASACFGDSGGPVLRRSGAGYALVGVITRANYPRRAIACGFYTRYAPVSASGGSALAAKEETAEGTPASAEVSSPSRSESRRVMRRAQRLKPEAKYRFAFFSPASLADREAYADEPVRPRLRKSRIRSR